MKFAVDNGATVNKLIFRNKQVNEARTKFRTPIQKNIQCPDRIFLGNPLDWSLSLPLGTPSAGYAKLLALHPVQQQPNLVLLQYTLWNSLHLFQHYLPNAEKLKNFRNCCIHGNMKFEKAIQLIAVGGQD